jgi:hypothetical protein
MRIGRVLDWETEVLDIWTKGSPEGYLPSEGLIKEFPQGICWMAGVIEPDDIEKLLVIAAADWQQLFGTFQLADIARRIPETGDDEHRHYSRIRELTRLAEAGQPFYPPILVAKSGQGPFVIIDGNHRVLGMQRAKSVLGKQVIIGFLPPNVEYHRYDHAVLVTRAAAVQNC